MFGVGQRSNVHKVAVLLTLLGREAAQEIMKQFAPADVERIGREMVKCESIAKSEAEKVVHEFLGELQRMDTLIGGGARFVQEVVAPVMGAERAERILREVERAQPVVLFEGLREIEPEKIIAVLQGEHPQAIAVVLANLTSDLSAQVMMHLSAAKQLEVAKRLAVLDKSQLDLEMAREIERRLEARLRQEENRGKVTKLGGVQSIANILNEMDKNAVKRILEELEAKQPALAEEIKLKLVRFEDLIKLDDLEIQRVLKEVETADLATGLLKIGKEIEEAVFRNMSQRGAEMLKEDMEVMRNVKPEAIRGARLKIAESMRRLDEQGVIVLNKGFLENEVV